MFVLTDNEMSHFKAEKKKNNHLRGLMNQTLFHYFQCKLIKVFRIQGKT